MDPRKKTEMKDMTLVDYWSIILSNKKIIALFVTLVTIASIGYSLILPKTYKSTALIMPLGQAGSSKISSLMAQFGGLSSIMGIGGGGNTTSQLMVLLKSNTIAEEVVNDFDLKKVLFKDGWDKKNNKWKGKEPSLQSSAEALRTYVSFSENKKEGTIAVTAEFEDPKLTADVVNGYLVGLQRFISNNALTAAKRNRIFIEQQLAQNKQQLLMAGKELNEFYKGNKVSNIESKIDVSVAPQSGVEAGQSVGVGSSENEGSNANHQNVELNRLQKEKAKADSMLMVKDVPQQVYLQYLTLRRNLLAQINTLLAQQYEMAKIDESKEELSFQIIDSAQVPERRFKPERRKIVTMAFLIAMFFSVFGAFVKEYVQNIKSGSSLN